MIRTTATCLMSVVNAVMPEGPKITDIQCCFLASPFVYRDCSRFSKYENDLMYCRQWACRYLCKMLFLYPIMLLTCCQLTWKLPSVPPAVSIEYHLLFQPFFFLPHHNVFETYCCHQIQNHQNDAPLLSHCLIVFQPPTPHPPISHDRRLLLPDCGSAGGFIWLKGSFSFQLSPSASSQGVM